MATKLEITKYEPNYEWDIYYVELSDGSCWFEDEQRRFRSEPIFDLYDLSIDEINRRNHRRLDHRINISSVTWDWDKDCFVFKNGRPIPWSEHDDEFPELDDFESLAKKYLD